MRTRRLALIQAVAALLPVLSAMPAAAQASQAPTHRATSAHKTTRPASMPLIDVEGYRRVLEKYRGKPVMVNFWATWCEPCRYEFPMVVELTRQYAPKGLAVFGVNLDSDADMHVARNFLAKNQPPFPSFRQKPGIDVDAFYHGVNPAWTGTMPQTIFYDRSGRIVGYFFGGQSREAFEQAIRTILASPEAAPGSH
jgi:cytochrome c biogenesis protein CcmG, thiol:disulfide interchange protein DsbE